MPNVGPLELAIVLIIALVVFGPKRLPELGKSVGRGIREFKGAISGDDDDKDEPQSQAKIESAQPPPPPSESAKAEKADETVVHDRGGGPRMPRRVRAVSHEDRLTVVEHLDELRTRIVVCVVVFG